MSSLLMRHGVLHTVALLNFFLLTFSVSCDEKRPLQSSPEMGAAEQEKNRLGSSPPSCHNRCNACNPCTAVQVPTFPGPIGGFGRIGADNLRLADMAAAYSQYHSNYKPLGWKCRCGDRVYNP